MIAGGAPLIQERMNRLTEAADMLGFLLVDEAHFSVEPETAARSLTEDSRPVLEAALAALDALDDAALGHRRDRGGAAQGARRGARAQAEARLRTRSAPRSPAAGSHRRCSSRWSCSAVTVR